MIRILQFLAIGLSLYLCSCKAEDDPPEVDLSLRLFNLDFEVRSDANRSLPAHWSISGVGFTISLDDAEKHSGMLSLKMERQGDRDGRYGFCTNRFLSIATVAGKTVEYRGWIKTKGVINGYAGLWFSVNDGNGRTIGYDNMVNNGVAGDTDWVQVSIKMDVSSNAEAIYFGCIFPGEGIAWFDDLEIVIIDPSEVDPDFNKPNLDFEVRRYENSLLPANWYIGGTDFDVSLDNVEKHSGLLSLKAERQGGTNGSAMVFTSNLPVEMYAGKNVEYRGWIKTKGVQNGCAGLMFNVEGETGSLGYDNMYNRGLIGDNDWTQVSIKMDVSNNAKAIALGGYFSGEGIAWFDNLELIITEPKTSLSQEELTVLKNYVYPLRTFEPDGGDTQDLKILDELIGHSKVVGLGENSHGSSEIFKMKNRIIQYLAANNGFDIFSIEASMPEAYKLNDYTVRGEGDPRKLIAGMHFWTWRTEEVLDMVEWMRRFNEPKQRILFTGFDMQYYSGVISELSDAFQGDTEVEAIITGLKKKLDENAGVNEIEPLLLFLQNTIENSLFQPSEQAWLQQNIEIIRQLLVRQFQGAGVPLWRDIFMANNFMWITEQNPDSKFVIWAHNMHVHKSDLLQGFYLTQSLGNDYIAFGFTFFEGSYIANGSRGVTSYEAVTAYPGTLEYLLNQLNEPIFILDLKKIKSDHHKDTQWLMEYLLFRDADEYGDLLTSEYVYRKIVDDFDYLIFIKRSSPSSVFEVNNE